MIRHISGVLNKFRIFKVMQPATLIRPRVIDFFSKEFAKNELMTKALKISPADERIAFRPIINDINCNIYLALQKKVDSYEKEEEIAGSILTMDLARYMTLEFNGIPRIMEPSAQIMTEIDRRLNILYPDLRLAKGRALHVPAVAVAEPYIRQGLGEALFKIALHDSKKAGYSIAYSEATSSKSQKLQAKIGAATLAKIVYKHFKYQDSYPFADINDNESIQLMQIDIAKLSGNLQYSGKKYLMEKEKATGADIWLGKVAVEEVEFLVEKEMDLIPVVEEKGRAATLVTPFIYGDAFEVYYVSAMNILLSLRVAELSDTMKSKIKLLPSHCIKNSSQKSSLDTVISIFANESKQDKIVMMPLLISPLQEESVMHWIGIISYFKDEVMIVDYLDSENQKPSILLEESIVKRLQRHNPEKEIVFNIKSLEQQRYSNCGPELIENFVYCLTGTRATQEGAAYVHSLLLENMLLDPVEYALKILENNKLIKLLSNQIAVMVDSSITNTNRLLEMSRQQEVLGLDILILSTTKIYLNNVVTPVQNNALAVLSIQSYDLNVVSPTTLVVGTTSSCNLPEQQLQGQEYVFFTFIYNAIVTITKILNHGTTKIWRSIIDVIMQNNYVKHQLINYMYHAELLAISNIINKPYIQSSKIPAVQSLLQRHPSEWNKSDFKKIKLQIHPDKGGNNEDFHILNTFQKQMCDEEQIYQNLLPQLSNIQSVIYKSNIGFKALDMLVNFSKLIYEPTFQNAKKVVLDSAHLYSTYQSINSVSALIGGAGTIYQTYYGDYTQAFQIVITTIGFMALPILLKYTTTPYLDIAYGIGIAGYIGYNAIYNTYLFYLEINSDVAMLKSTMSYKGTMNF